MQQINKPSPFSPWNFMDFSVSPLGTVMSSLMALSTLYLKIGKLDNDQALASLNMSTSQAELVGAFQEQEGEMQEWDCITQGIGQVTSAAAQVGGSIGSFAAQSSELENTSESYESAMKGPPDVALNEGTEMETFKSNMTEKQNATIEKMTNGEFDLKTEPTEGEKKAFSQATDTEKEKIKEQIEKKTKTQNDAISRKYNMINELIKGSMPAITGVASTISGTLKNQASQMQAQATLGQNTMSQMNQMAEHIHQKGESYFQLILGINQLVEKLTESNKIG